LQMDRQNDSILHQLPPKSGFSRVRSLFYTLAHGYDLDYKQFENRSGDMTTFNENHKEFQLFGTQIHVKIGAYAASLIGLSLTVIFCVCYWVLSNMEGSHALVDHIELVDLIFTVLVGIPCHVLLAIGVRQERKHLFGPFLVFYSAIFVVSVFFTVLTTIAAALDFHKKLFGNVEVDAGWLVFQLIWTLAQGLAIYVVFKCRRFVAAKNHFRAANLSPSRTA
ncbi:hypothetical protein PENTCL1PPCAC_173, partial [Pristionchus entomophagus]